VAYYGLFFKGVVHGGDADVIVFIVNKLFVDLIGDEEETMFQRKPAYGFQVLAVKYAPDGI
jgi:hypothetical protein